MKLFEEFRLYETMWDEEPGAETRSSTTAFDPAEIKACLARVNTNATEQASKAEIDANYGSICVKLSEEDLKKALRIGSRGGYTDGDGMTIPAQLVEMVSLEITRAEDKEDGVCTCLLELYGENEKTGESTHEYNNEDVPFVGDTTIPGTPIDSDEEFIEYIKTEIFPNADRIAHDIINETWNKFGFNDYEGITDYNYDTGVTGYDEEDDEVDDDWSELLKQADSLLGKLIRASGNTNYNDGDGYWEEEYSTWCYRYLYYGNLPNAVDLEKACEEYSNKLPNVEFYYVDDEECSEIGYTAER